MVNGISATFDVKEVMKALHNLPINIQKNVIVGATRAAANVVSDEAKRLVPVKSGNLRDSITVVASRSRNKKWMTYALTTKKMKSKRTKLSNGKTLTISGSVADGFYGHMVEFGTYAKRKEKLHKRTKYSGKRAIARDKKIAKGYGMNPRPFMQPAAEKDKEAFEASVKFMKQKFLQLVKSSKW